MADPLMPPTRLAVEYLLLSGRDALAPAPIVDARPTSPLDGLDDEERIALRHAIDAELARREAAPDPDTMTRS